jgi:hypothetical protein
MIARAVWSSQVSIEGDCRAILSIFLIKPTVKQKKKSMTIIKNKRSAEERYVRSVQMCHF